MKFQGRGKTYLAPRDGDGNVGPVTLELCTDTLVLGLQEETFEHFNRCGAVDVVDFRGTKSQGATITMTVPEIADEELMAVGMKGRIDPASSSGSVTDEILPDDIIDGDSYFLGGNDPHQDVTSVVITDSAGSPATLTVDDNYTVDAETGRVNFLDTAGFTQPFKASYGYTDRKQVSFFTAPTLEYMLTYDYINKANANRKGLVQLWKTRFSPFDNLDLQPDELSIPTVTGAALADENRDDDDRLGRFGRIIL